MALPVLIQGRKMIKMAVLSQSMIDDARYVAVCRWVWVYLIGSSNGYGVSVVPSQRVSFLWVLTAPSKVNICW